MKAGKGGPSDETLRERLHAVPVVDLRPVIAPPGEESDGAAADTAPAPAAEEAPASAPPGGGSGWLIPFLAGALVGAGGFYAALWLLALI